MYTFIVQNERGESLELTHNDAYSVTKIDGLGPPLATINTTPMAGGDGSSFNSSSINNRNIVIYLTIDREPEYNRRRLYRYFRNKRKCRLFYKNSSLDVYIDGYVEDVVPGIFEQKQAVQISVLCNNPYFKNINASVYNFSWTSDGFEFPFSIPEEGIEFSTSDNISSLDIVNNGEQEVGVEINLIANGSVLNPTIINVTTGERFTLNVDMDSGDQIVITTHKGNKHVNLIRNGVTTNIMNTVASNPTWFKIDIGDNIFSYSADEGGELLDVSFTLTEEFLGV